MNPCLLHLRSTLSAGRSAHSARRWLALFQTLYDGQILEEPWERMRINDEFPQISRRN